MKIEIYQPLKPFFITQKFGENRACVGLNNKVITCDGNNPPEGYRSLYGTKGHLGLDLRAYHGQEVYCVLDGYVDAIDTNERSGLDVRIVSEKDGRKIRCISEHLLGYQVRVGDVVKTGQLIGWADNTGYSSGDHLHFVVQEWLNNEWVEIDPLSIMKPIFAKRILMTENMLKFIAEQVAMLTDRVASYLRERSLKNNSK